MVRHLLAQIRAFYTRHAPVACATHQHLAPAQEIDLLQFEHAWQAPLPTDYREFLRYNDLCHNFKGNYACLDFPGMVQQWRSLTQHLQAGHFDDGRVAHHKEQGFGNWAGAYLQEVWWHPHWLPFAADGCGNLLCLDGAPGPNGRLYQVLYMEVQDGQGPFVSEYRSLLEFLSWHLLYLQRRQYVVDEAGLEITP